MGPAPVGTTTALLQPTVARHEQGRHSGVGPLPARDDWSAYSDE